MEGRSVLMKYISFLLSDFFVLLSRQLHNFIFNVYDEGDLISSLKGSKMIAFSISVVSMHSSFKAFRSFVSQANYLVAFGKPAGHREVAPREFDAHALGGIRERSRREKKEKKKKKGRRRQSRKTEAACVASVGCNNLFIVCQISTAPSKAAPGTMYEPLA